MRRSLNGFLVFLSLGTSAWASDLACPTLGASDGCSAIDSSFSTFASTVSGGTLLSQASADQITAWLGLTDVLYTNIFSEAYTGASTITDFHAAADNKGKTIVVMQVTPQGSSTPVLIGGYDPVSWNAALNGYVLDPTDAGRTAFIYNLSTTTIQRQNLTAQGSPGSGQYQTYDNANYGPNFGGGFDIGVYNGYAYTYTYNYSYGGTAAGGVNILGNSGLTFMTVNKIEVFTVFDESPEPSTFFLMAAGLGAAAWLRRKKQSRFTFL